MASSSWVSLISPSATPGPTPASVSARCPAVAALSNEPELGPEWATEATRSYLFLRAASIYGGTNEIQKNILTKAVLGL